MKDTRNLIGRRGEEAVCRYLIEKGHCILERNWRTGHLEVDIISLDRDGIHFVEVKTRVAPILVEPEQNVRKDKQRKIAKAALLYMKSKDDRKGWDEMEIHLDVSAVVLEGGKETIRYFEDAYIPIYV